MRGQEDWRRLKQESVAKPRRRGAWGGSVWGVERRGRRKERRKMEGEEEQGRRGGKRQERRCKGKAGDVSRQKNEREMAQGKEGSTVSNENECRDHNGIPDGFEVTVSRYPRYYQVASAGGYRPLVSTAYQSQGPSQSSSWLHSPWELLQARQRLLRIV